ncbi:MAG TPA: adenylate/guanylate cyclase domain-containing protein [Nitrososphaerales archaeon]|nr:adenylate/guanylate cyclase domain-containing protein [Nitrososphaerales archaeon]
MSSGQRRLAAIMYTDMVGYTALGQRNESLSLAMVEEQRSLIRPVLARHGGREVKTMGDACLVEFQSALEAVRCAYDIQRAIREYNFSLSEERRIHLRVGIHVGDVVDSQGDISGDAVNIASRIEPLADSDGVCITRQVYDQVQNKFELGLSSAGLKPLKNVSAPVEVFKVVMPWSPGRPVASISLDRRRIAVLPFVNMSPDPNDEYFADGLTEELITTMSNIAGLQVISRTSAMQFKRTSKTTGEIARQLETGSVLEGSVRKAGDKVRVTVQLVDGNTDIHVWASSYDRQLQDVFAIQSDIAARVVGSLKVRLLPAEKARIQTRETENVAAYEAYLKGRSLLREGTEKAVRLAREQFELAIQEDEGYAKAYAGKADSMMALGDYLFAPIPVALEEAKRCVERALSLDPDLAEARVSRANLMMYDYRFAEAEEEYRTVLEANPSYASGHHSYSTCLQTLGRSAEALSEVLEAERLDPLSPSITLSVIYRLSARGAQEEVQKRVRKLEELDHEGALLDEALMANAFTRRDWGAVLKHLGRMIDRDPNDPYLDSDLAYVYAVTGRREEALGLVEKLKGVPEDARVKGQLLAFDYTGLGDLDAAFRWLEYAVSKKETFISWVRSHPLFAPVRADPRFGELLRSAGLPADAADSGGSMTG